MRIKDVIQSVNNGSFQISSFRKVSSQVTTAGTWCDLSMSSGNPVPNFYSGSSLIATTLDGNKGLYVGSGRYVFETLAYAGGANAAPITLTLCDYLLFYPQIDMNNVDPQEMDNTITLPRYSDGNGVRMFLVAQYPFVGGANFSISYTNSNGDANRSTGTIRSNSVTSISSFVHSGAVANSFGAFLPLQSGDTGVRSVESITFASPNGGLAALVLVKPIYTTMIRELTAPYESNTIKDSALLPEIKAGAYLNFIALPSANISAVPIQGHIQTIF